MSVKQLFFYLGCAISWFVALPVFVIGGGIALLTYAVCSEVGDFLCGGSKQSESADARERARLMCLPH